jgi:hypothetical protein
VGRRSKTGEMKWQWRAESGKQFCDMPYIRTKSHRKLQAHTSPSRKEIHRVNIIHTCMNKNSTMKPTKTVKKEGEKGEWLRVIKSG